MILAIPYYDPDGRYNACFRQYKDLLLSTFEAICLSVIAPTETRNASFLHELSETGCTLVQTAPEGSFGQPSRDALRCAAKDASSISPVFFGFLDRILFALDTEWRSSFLADLHAFQTHDFCVFERSPAAWATHPSNYREVEQMITQMGHMLWGLSIEWSPGALLMSPSTVQMVLQSSVSPSFAIWGEWILLALTHHIGLTQKSVDWLTWEDPYWEQTDVQALKHRRESSQDETRRRIAWNTPILQLFTEERFTRHASYSKGS